MLKPATSVDEDIIHIITLTFKVDGENLNYNYNDLSILTMISHGQFIKA